MVAITSPAFEHNAREALGNAGLQKVLAFSKPQFMARRTRAVCAYEEAWDLLRVEGPMPRNVMLVTGPSRSADIEQTLELGTHGPRRLQVLLIEDDPAAKHRAVA